ncbi:MAG: hypothetical protein P8189_17420 [Anaerolineae bacterium]|jgi:hypothetical protein
MTGRNDFTVSARCRMATCLTLLCLVISLVACLGTDPAPEKLVTERCTKCHTLAPIQVSHKTYREWEATVYRMMDKGARLNRREAKAVIDYLSQTYGPIRQ